MTRRLLSLLFPSNYPNFAADSIYTFNRIVAASLKELDPLIEIHIAGPPRMPPLHSSIFLHEFSTGANKFHVRFGFPWAELAQIIQAVKPHLILVNMPEQAAAVSVLTRDELGLCCRIVSYIHYIPAIVEERPDKVVYEPSMDAHGNGQLLVIRLLEGVMASDLVLVGSQFGVRLLNSLACRLLGTHVRLPPIKLLAPPVDVRESEKGATEGPAEHPYFVYNHRLYNEYGTQLLFSLLKEAAAHQSRRFEILVTNPTAGRAVERQRLNTGLDDNLRAVQDLPFVRVQHFYNRDEYFRAIGRSWGGIAPYKLNALWSMSVLDVLATGRPVLSFDILVSRTRTSR